MNDKHLRLRLLALRYERLWLRGMTLGLSGMRCVVYRVLCGHDMPSNEERKWHLNSLNFSSTVKMNDFMCVDCRRHRGDLRVQKFYDSPCYRTREVAPIITMPCSGYIPTNKQRNDEEFHVPTQWDVNNVASSSLPLVGHFSGLLRIEWNKKLNVAQHCLHGIFIQMPNQSSFPVINSRTHSTHRSAEGKAKWKKKKIWNKL